MSTRVPIDAEVDLDLAEAQAITGRIRTWIKDYPIEDVIRAYTGRVWLAMGYTSWGEWGFGEMNGFILPAPKRGEVGGRLADAGLSNRAAAAALGVSEGTIRNDRKAGAQDCAADCDVTGQDGKTYRRKPDEQIDVVDLDAFPKKGRGNEKKQLHALEAVASSLRGVADGLEAHFDGGFEKTCTPEIVREYLTSHKESIARIKKIVALLARYERSGAGAQAN
jgi:hypothetical protein